MRKYGTRVRVAVTLSAVMMMVGAEASAKPLTTIRFGVEAAYPPFESKTTSGQLQGFDIDLGNALCAQLKARCVWVENAFDGLIPALQARKFDAIDSAMNINAKRARQVDFTVPLYLTPAHLVARKGSKLLPTPESLAGHSVGVLQGSIQEQYAKQIWAPGNVNVVSYQTQDEAYADLVSGRIDATFVDATAASLGFLNQPNGKDFAFAGGPVNDAKIIGSGVGIAVRKGDDELRDALNTAFEALKQNGTYQRLLKKYFTVDLAVH
ncbi:ABC transporter substrate-binding protein [Burkholderia sp. JKS000303]|uniref:ABC transporter substrate-binding protein n=1 Tax=Burkholderia sp. JKS000303 TaxID=1938747 RepID=UPI000BF5C81E|nr:ABC transporter substrate-binding protein [Burkholderia sp. JKS000303]PFH20712.1 lysine/arginine/ornithine transport system substrate-binding protein [Burkholderia sp. JKS000303]